MFGAHGPVRRWRTIWLVVGCVCGFPRWRGPRCPIDESAERIGDGDTVPLPAVPAVVVDEKTRLLPVVPYRRRLLTLAGEWRANGGQS